jgi:hypothetical protein
MTRLALQLVATLTFFQSIAYGAITSMRAENSGLCADVPGGWSGTGWGIQQYTCNGTGAQRYDFLIAPDGSYRIQTQTGSNLCLDAGAGSGAQIVQNACNGAVSQKWKVYANPDASYTVSTSNGAGCIAIEGGSIANGARLVTETCAGGATQKFTMPDFNVISTSGTTVPNAQNIVDGSSNVWTISTGSRVVKNGTVDSNTWNVALVLYYNHLVYHRNMSGNWYVQSSTSASGWSGTTDPRPVDTSPATNISTTGNTEVDLRSNTSVSGMAPDSNGLPFNWGYIVSGGYVTYNLDVAQGGNYQIVLRHASPTGSAGVNVLLNGISAGNVAFSATEGWGTYVFAPAMPIDLPAGRTTLKIEALNSGFNLGGISIGPNTVSVRTSGGVPLPIGWSLKVSDRFGTGPDSNVGTHAQLHSKYYEAQYYNRDANGLVRIPNVVINGEQQTYRHFEEVVKFYSDHLTIEARGHADNSISSGEMVSIYTARNFCVEAKYKIPSLAGTWPAFWQYAATSGDNSELDIEQPISPNQGVHDVTMHNHPDATNVVIHNSDFTTRWMTWHNASFDASTAPHVYTSCYEDVGSGKVTRFIDGIKIYSATWKWNASLGGTGHGPDATTIFNLAVGGRWPGYVSNPSAVSADLDLYSMEYYGP